MSDHIPPTIQAAPRPGSAGAKALLQHVLRPTATLLAGGYVACVRAVLLVLALALAAGTIRTLGSTVLNLPAQLSHFAGVVGAILAVAWVLAALLLARHVSRRSVALPGKKFLLGLVAASIVIHLGLIATVAPPWAGDYMRYWQHAQTMAADEDGPLVFNVWSQRALLFAYPIAELFGAQGQTWMKFLNLLILLAIQLLAFDVMRLLRDVRAAQTLSILLLAAPMPAFSILIPSHDLWGLLWFTLTLWAYTRLYRGACEGRYRWFHAVPVLAFVSVAVFCLELQRTTGILFAMVFLLASIGHVLVLLHRGATRTTWRAAATILTIAIGALVSQPLLSGWARTNGLMENNPQRDAQQAMKLAAHGAAMGTARSQWSARFLERFGAKTRQGTSATLDFSRSVVLSNWILQPLDKLHHAANNLPRMFEPGYPIDWDVTLANPSGVKESTRRSLIFSANVFGIAVAMLAIFALARLATARQLPSLPLLALCATIAGMALTLAVLFENKPPNIFPVWCAWTLLATLAIDPHERTTADENRIRRRIGRATGAVAVASVLVGMFWVVCAAFVTEADGRVLDRWSMHLETLGTAPSEWQKELDRQEPEVFARKHLVSTRLPDRIFRDEASDGPRLKHFSNSLYAILELPVPMRKGSRATMSQEICDIGTTRRSLELFVFAPYRNPRAIDVFALQIAVDGNVHRTMPIPLRSAKTLELLRIDHPFDASDCHRVDISLVSNVDRDQASWKEASRVEVWFPRLVP